MKRQILALNWVLTDGLETNKVLFHILMSVACKCTENYDDCALGPLVQRFYWLANQSHVFRGLDPHKKDSEKSSKRLKAGSANRRLGVLATLFATTATLPRVLNLTVPSNITLLRKDSGIAVIACQLITELKALVVVVIVVHDSFFINV